jgi:outer membrane immunogenic protein
MRRDSTAQADAISTRYAETIMKSLATGVIVAFALPLISIAAQAADQKVVYKAPPPATLPANTGVGYGDWSGFYVGINGGGDNLIGGTFGYNYQTGMLVLGAEGDLDTAWASTSSSTPYLGTLRGRLGMAFGQFMPYFTGGIAVSSGASGSAVGGGMEWRLTPTMSFKAEYLRVDLDHANSFLPSGADNIVRIGLNWRLPNFLNGPIVARY